MCICRDSVTVSDSRQVAAILTLIRGERSRDTSASAQANPSRVNTNRVRRAEDEAPPEDSRAHNALPTCDASANDSCSTRDIDTGCAGSFLSVASHLQRTPYSTFQGLSKPRPSQTSRTASLWQRSQIAFGYAQRETREKYPSRLIREGSGASLRNTCQEQQLERDV